MSKQQIILMIGVSCSGKTTWATNYIKNNPTYKILSRDNIREQIFGKEYEQNNRNEETVSKIFKETAHILLKNHSLILDNTHLKLSYINDVIEEFGYLANITIKIIDSTVIPYRDLCERNNKRKEDSGKFIPWDVLNKQIVNFTNLDLTKLENIEPYPKELNS